MNNSQYKIFENNIEKVIPKKYIFTDKLTTLAYGTDASCYRLIPKIVIKAQNEQHVQNILYYANELDLPVTFRASGTSLSGQAISDSILVVLQEGWTKYKVSEDGSYIDLDVGIIASKANSYLSKFNKKIGPDPATITSARIGGIISNNSSGMCCGVTENSYQTIKDMRLIMVDGTILDTRDIESITNFKKTHKTLLENLESLANAVQNNSDLSELIRKKFKIKNTTGYSLNSLTDFSEGIEILKHLIIGSEGTLAFISNVSYFTVDDFPHKASGLIFFENIIEACSCVSGLQDLGKLVNSAEFMDRTSLKTMENEYGIPPIVKELPLSACAILIQTTGISKENIDDNIGKISELINRFKTIGDINFTDREEEYSKYWKLRKGLLTKVGAVRPLGTTLIIEDITFPHDFLAEGTNKLRLLLNESGYEDSVIFGHSLASNLHFVLCINFSNEAEVKNYDDFMRKMTDLIAIEYKGSLKAEHGTGRNIAPFVEKEWGEKAYLLMIQIKDLFDPKRLLNPDVIITKDKDLHLKNLKEMNPCNSLIDSCIECGFCEDICPSKNITLTPRQRIVAYRAIRNSNQPQLMQELLSLKNTYKYQAMDTCAACSLCSTVCPVGINVGDLTKELRADYQNFLVNKGSILFAKTYFMASFNLRSMLRVGTFLKKILGNTRLNKITKLGNKLSLGLAPIWRISMPKAADISKLKYLKSMNKLSLNTSDEKTFVYFISCMSKMFGSQEHHPLVRNKPVYEVMAELAEKSGYKMITVTDNSLCCGKTFSSKGLNEAAEMKSLELKDKLLYYSKNGKYPIVTDLSSCALEMISYMKETNLEIYDLGEFALKYLANNLNIIPLNKKIAIHVTCATTKLNDKGALLNLAKLCAEEVIAPTSVTCCGFAGDKGMFYPELNASALSGLHEEVKDCHMGFSTNCSCEIGLSEHAKIPYASILYLLNEVSTIHDNI